MHNGILSHTYETKYTLITIVVCRKWLPHKYNRSKYTLKMETNQIVKENDTHHQQPVNSPRTAIHNSNQFSAYVPAFEPWTDRGITKSRGPANCNCRRPQQKGFNDGLGTRQQIPTDVSTRHMTVIAFIFSCMFSTAFFTILHKNTKRQ